jgi:mevalonate kinase
MVMATAPGKVILVGEHAVVYGRPAIAVPVWETVATATVEPGAAGEGCVIVARDVGRTIVLAEAGDDEPLAVAVRQTLAHLGLSPAPDWRVELTSQIPIASGMGSGAALSAALVRSLFAQAGVVPNPAMVSDLVYTSEQLYHGTPSGIDNTVVAYAAPVWFVKEQSPEVFVPARPFMLAIGDSGAASPTKETVGAVRLRRQADPARHEAWFDAIGEVAAAARQAIEQGAPERIGPLFDQNHALLVALGVSTPELDRLVAAARAAGAGGAKLSGGGGGGNMIALVDETTAEGVAAALRAAGAVRVIITTVDVRSAHLM